MSLKYETSSKFTQNLLKRLIFTPHVTLCENIKNANTFSMEDENKLNSFIVASVSK